MRDLGATEGEVMRFVLISADPERRRGRDRRGTVGTGWMAGIATLEREFPSVTLKTTTEVVPVTPAVRVLDWTSTGWNPYEFDAELVRLDKAAPQRLNVVGEP